MQDSSDERGPRSIVTPLLVVIPEHSADEVLALKVPECDESKAFGQIALDKSGLRVPAAEDLQRFKQVVSEQGEERIVNSKAEIIAKLILLPRYNVDQCDMVTAPISQQSVDGSLDTLIDVIVIERSDLRWRRQRRP